ncbi:hypothetical protein GGH12_001826 [Coemansia sp. RSA 1822]|nr:hypothetical protein LPJ76_002069 [Coemansia sp. RSA 638]KAJ2122818.1 hypothetical protein IW147_003102 [Coemansia sp. RSA 720]KAJ2543870.1 hypothetical protein GGF49_001717 [Coemansia sp. RSA 1853]KAJ2564752.1 hypothetical protein GGH12_001826 [Coemansia sp. RSA 1822]
MADGTDAASTQALAAAVAAVTAPGFSPGVNPAMTHMPGTAPFPKLQPETGVSADQAVAAAVSAAFTGVTAVPMSGVVAGTMAMPMTGVTGQMSGPMSAAMLMGTTATMGGDSVIMGTTAMSGDAVLASLQHNAHDQMLEIMHTYHTTNAHRRRSSVEAAAAASSVLASIASSAKPYMDGDMAAAAAMAAAGSPTHVTYSARQQQTAAAALLAASSMGTGMLPTIPSGTASLRNTPPPAGSDAPSIGASLAGLAFATLSPQTFSAEQTFAAEHQITDQQITANDASLTATPARRNQADASPSSDENDENDENDGPVDEDGMPLTPGAPGSGRPGSLRHLTTDERRARRLQRNRLAAKECRQKKKAYIQNLEDQVSALQDDNAQLRKTIEELNAKLTLSAMRATSSASTPVMDAKRVPETLADDESIESMSSPALAKRPRVAERSTSNTQVQNGD